MPAQILTAPGKAAAKKRIQRKGGKEMSIYCFGIDVGGTSVKCGLFKTDGTLLEKWEIPTRT